jgi:hypothetical protein
LLPCNVHAAGLSGKRTELSRSRIEITRPTQFPADWSSIGLIRSRKRDSRRSLRTTGSQPSDLRRSNASYLSLPTLTNPRQPLRSSAPFTPRLAVTTQSPRLRSHLLLLRNHTVAAAACPPRNHTLAAARPAVQLHPRRRSPPPTRCPPQRRFPRLNLRSCETL